jgi:phosphoserine phosphatase
VTANKENDTMTNARTPVDIIADWISNFAGDDKPVEEWLPDAEVLLGWLRDEGYSVVKEEATP